jgi:hypothetical protein
MLLISGRDFLALLRIGTEETEKVANGDLDVGCERAVEIDPMFGSSAFAMRSEEPFIAKCSKCSLDRGFVSAKQPLKLAIAGHWIVVEHPKDPDPGVDQLLRGSRHAQIMTRVQALAPAPTVTAVTWHSRRGFAAGHCSVT